MNETENNLLDISKLISGEQKEIPYALKDVSFPEETDGIRIESIDFSGRAYDQSGFPRLGGFIRAKMNAPCARCLTSVTQMLELHLDYSIRTDEEDDPEEESIRAEGHKIDLFALMEEAIFTNLPLRLICREDCRGLCPRCGKDLNEGNCSCEQKEIDPRLAGLADFFKD